MFFQISGFAIYLTHALHEASYEVGTVSCWSYRLVRFWSRLSLREENGAMYPAGAGLASVHAQPIARASTCIDAYRR